MPTDLTPELRAKVEARIPELLRWADAEQEAGDDLETKVDTHRRKEITYRAQARELQAILDE